LSRYSIYKPKRRINISIKVIGIIKVEGIDVIIIKGISRIISVSKIASVDNNLHLI